MFEPMHRGKNEGAVYFGAYEESANRVAYLW